jgi:capsular exopolysaccharide synthesis family protein
MSQLERALRKARAENGDTGSEVSQHRPLANAAFVSAWALDESRDATATAVLEPPVPVPVRSEPLSAARPASHLLHSQAASRFRSFNSAIRPKLVIGKEALPDVREEFGKIAAVLYRLRETQPVRVMMVVSAIPGEGKSLTAMNLSLTLSEAYKSNVLLIDADLRRPTVHSLLDIASGSGLKEALTSEIKEPLPTVSITPHLQVLTAGTTAVDPMGALISDRMRNLLGDAAETFDWVVIDTPPVTLLPDAHLLAGMTDVAILVVGAGSTNYALAREAIDIIGRERIVGVVLNKVLERNGAGDYGHYYGHPHGSQPAAK